MLRQYHAQIILIVSNVNAQIMLNVAQIILMNNADALYVCYRIEGKERSNNYETSAY